MTNPPPPLAAAWSRSASQARAFYGLLNPGTWQPRVVLPAVLLLGLLLTGATLSARQASVRRGATERSYLSTLDVLLTAGDLKVAVLTGLRGERGFLLTDNAAFLDLYFKSRPAMWGHLIRLRNLTREDPIQQSTLDRLNRQVGNYIAMLARTIALERAGRPKDAVAIVRAGTGKHAVDEILAEIGTMEHHQQQLLDLRSALADAAARDNARVQNVLTGIGFLLLALGTAAALSGRRAHLKAQQISAALRALAATDELTGVANRREFLAALDREIAVATRDNRSLALAILDLDHFKQVNDRYGHPAGDTVIRSTATRAVTTLRASDLVGRLGGEEFGVLMPGIDEHDALIACERLRLAVQNQDIRLNDQQSVGVTLSIGLAELQKGETAPRLTARADSALYQAKTRGRNRIFLAPRTETLIAVVAA